jgi:two-component system response regulator AtoC
MAHTLLSHYSRLCSLRTFNSSRFGLRGLMVNQVDENLISIEAKGTFSGLIQYFVHGVSPAMRALERTIADIAPTDIPVLLVGESGTGKEVVALEIHRLSRRWNEAFVKCGCAGLTGESIAARLNCGQRDIGDSATSSGTLFLDEISHLDSASQARLLNLLPNSVGVPTEQGSSARIISSTTHNLEEEMRNGRFFEELYYRINGVCLRMPPLRHRKDDIPELLNFFLKKYASLFARMEPQLGPATMDLLFRHSWPGNIRELENVARKIVALGNEQLAVEDLVICDAPKAAESTTAPLLENMQSPGRSLKEASREASRRAEREMILKQLERTHWNRKRTARELQISYKALLYKLKQLGLDGSGNAERQ